MTAFSTLVAIENLLLGIDVEMSWTTSIEWALLKAIFSILEFESPSLKG